jgi:hypothetical protein
MFIELVSSLRCPRPHDETWLVALPAAIDDHRMIVQGTLGCPVCGTEFAVRDGVTYMGDFDTREDVAPADASPYEALRCAALLDLGASASGTALLCGNFGASASQMLDLTSAHIALLNPPRSIARPAGVSVIVADRGAYPFARASLWGAALSDPGAGPTEVAAVAALVRHGGRLVAPVTCQMPSAARLLASDESHWVAEVQHPALAEITVRRQGKKP